MKIRRIEKKDRPRLETILKAQHHFRPVEIKVALELIDIALTQPGQEDYTILCTEGDGGEVPGYICYGKAPLTDAVYDLYWIVVHPVCQNRGIGSFLLRHAETELIHRQTRLLLVETSSLSQYESPRAFYRKHGYRELARVPDYYAPGDHKLIFSKNLEPGKEA